MNIFLLDKDPEKCAAYHCDKHVVKMILESAQLLCTAHWESGGEAQYKSTHKNHPCALWVRESLDNYNFLCELALALCHEYTLRYGKNHKTQKVIEWCIGNKPNLQRNGLTKFAQAMPEKYKNKNSIEAYRNYYKFEKKHLFSWKKRTVPAWLK